jgi:hypothetical protein
MTFVKLYANKRYRNSCGLLDNGAITIGMIWPVRFSTPRKNRIELNGAIPAGLKQVN